MDKSKVITAYKRGFMNIRECAQILGVDVGQITGLINDPHLAVDPQQNLLIKRSIIG